MKFLLVDLETAHNLHSHAEWFYGYSYTLIFITYILFISFKLSTERTHIDRKRNFDRKCTHFMSNFDRSVRLTGHMCDGFG